MDKIEITFDNETGYYDAIYLSKGIVTQAKTLDELLKNINEALSLSNDKKFILSKFNISFSSKEYVNF